MSGNDVGPSTEGSRNLRARAEARLTGAPPDLDAMLPVEVCTLVHELHVHQMELELQNEELRAAQVALADARDRYLDLYEFAPVGYLTVDAGHVIREANLTATRILDVERSKLVQCRFESVVVAEDRDACFQDLQAAADGVSPLTRERRVQRAGGKTAWIRIETIWRPASDDGEGEWRLTLQDVTARREREDEQRRLKRQLQDAQKLESLGILAGGIAHDFNNILTAVLGNASLALEMLPADSEVRPLIESVDHAAQRAAELTNQMLAYSGRGRFIVGPVDLSGVVREMAPLLESSIGKRVRLELDLLARLPAANADVTQIRQVALNLITNAAEALDDAPGTVTVRTGVVGAGAGADVRTSTGVPGTEYVYLEVQDTGCGMDQETQAKIFDPFFTTKFTGRGLGLAAVAGIVRAHGGDIQVRSSPGGGSTFRVLFPASTEVVALVPVEVGKADVPRATGTVLVVDDEASIRSMVRRVLEGCGCAVHVARDGREALALFERHRDEIDLVLLDLTMPDLGGLEVFSELRRLRPNVRVVLSSGYDEREATRPFGAGELAGFLHKPFRAKTLCEMVSAVLAREAVGRGPR